MSATLKGQATAHNLMSMDQYTGITTASSDETCTNDLLSIETILMSCPQCKHQFKLVDGLQVEDQEALSQQQQQQQQQQLPQPICNASCVSSVTRSETSTSATETTTQLTNATGTQPTVCTADLLAINSQEPALTQICQSFQIVNRTIDQLERLIRDPFDRRIRKISSMSQCDIEIRSELPTRKFGAAKNFCLVRAVSPCRIEKCRSLLRLQMGWVLLPRP